MCSEVEKNYCYDLPGDWPKFCLKKYDLIVDTEQWYYLSAIIGRMLRARCRCGFATNLRGRLFSVTAEYRQDDYEPISFYHLLDALSISRPNEIPEAFLKVSQDATRAVGNMLEGVQTPFVAFFPGASVVEKCWAVDKFRAVAKHVRDIGFGVVLVGGPQERDVAEQILPSMGGAVNFAGCLSLMETAAVLEKAQLVISGDSGLLHLALGVGGKTISVFGPTNDKKWAPRGNGHHVVKCAVPCSPCARYGTIPTCLYDCRCMNGIKSEQVLAAIDSALLPKA
nr:glycosyltransferase family 9 protein [uncultured Desulfuromonas sp.]